MFGSLKVNGQKIGRKITAREALPGFLVVVVPPNTTTAQTKAGDLVLKTTHGYTRIHDNPDVVNWSSCDKDVIVQYADVDITFKAVEVA